MCEYSSTSSFSRGNSLRCRDHRLKFKYPEPRNALKGKQMLLNEMMQHRIECGTCKGLMEYDSNAFLVSCPYCTSVNYSKILLLYNL